MLLITFLNAANTLFADTIQGKPLVLKDYLNKNKKQKKVALAFMDIEPYPTLKNLQIKSQFFPETDFWLRF